MPEHSYIYVAMAGLSEGRLKVETMASDDNRRVKDWLWRAHWGRTRGEQADDSRWRVIDRSDCWKSWTEPTVGSLNTPATIHRPADQY